MSTLSTLRPLGIAVPADAMISPPSAWAANVQSFLNNAFFGAVVATNAGITNVDWGYIGSIFSTASRYLGGGFYTCIDLSGNALTTAAVDACLLNANGMTGYAIFSSINLSGGTNGAPTPASVFSPMIFSLSGGDDTPLGFAGNATLMSDAGAIGYFNFTETDTLNGVIAGLLNYTGGIVAGNQVTISDPTYVAGGIPTSAGDVTFAVNVIQYGSVFAINNNAAQLIAAGVTVTTN